MVSNINPFRHDNAWIAGLNLSVFGAGHPDTIPQFLLADIYQEINDIPTIPSGSSLAFLHISHIHTVGKKTNIFPILLLCRGRDVF